MQWLLASCKTSCNADSNSYPRSISNDVFCVGLECLGKVLYRSDIKNIIFSSISIYFLRNLHTVLRSGCANLHSHQ